MYIDKEVLECKLCDNPANCKFLPCGHTVMCMECGERSKKCVECKVYYYNYYNNNMYAKLLKALFVVMSISSVNTN